MRDQKATVKLSINEPLYASNYTVPSSSPKITWIKVYRNVTRASLKEAKELVETAEANGGTINCEMNQSQIDGLKHAGFDIEVVDQPDDYLDDIAQNAKQAIDQGEYGLAVDLLDLVHQYKNR